MMEFLIILFSAIFAMRIEGSTKLPVVENFCQWDTFRASCPPDHVIVMMTAQYGRMKTGQCIKQDYGHLGCFADVLPYLDSLCSGRPECSLTVPDQTLKNMTPCLELESYLAASYVCHPVITGSRSLCRTEHRVSAPGEHNGTMSSYIAHTYGLGTPQCPWIISAQPGQRVNVTLLDFGVTLRSSEQNEYRGRSLCQKYAIIQDVTTGAALSGHSSARQATVCGSFARSRNVYLSEGHNVKISIMTRREAMEQLVPQFLLHYQVQGCSNPVLPQNVNMARKHDTIHYYCLHGDRTWVQNCVNNQWEGPMMSCDDSANGGSFWAVLYSDWSTPYGILIVASLGIILGIVIGVTLLIIALICIRRKRRNFEEKILEEAAMAQHNPQDNAYHQQRSNSLCRHPSINNGNGPPKAYHPQEYQTYESHATIPRQLSNPSNGCQATLGMPVAFSMPRETGKTETVEIRPNPPPFCEQPPTGGTDGGLLTFKPREEQVYEFLN